MFNVSLLLLLQVLQALTLTVVGERVARRKPRPFPGASPR